MTIPRYRFEHYTLDLAKRELQREGVAVALPSRVFECLGYLIEHRDRAIDRDELVRAVFGRADVSDAQLAQIVLRSRRAIGDDGQEQRSIRTVPRYGYRWVAPVAEECAAPESGESGHDAAPAGEDGATPSVGQFVDEAFLPPPMEARSSPMPAPSSTAPPTVLPSSTISDATLPATAAVLTALAPNPPRRRARPVVFAGGAVVVLAALAWLALRVGMPSLVPASAALPGGAILVMPMQVDGPGDAAWARLGLMDFLVDRMRRAGLPVLPSEATLSLLRENTEAAADPQRLRRDARIAWLVTSQVRRINDRWQVALTATDGSGLVQRGQASHDDLLDATRIAGDRLLATLGGSLPAGDEPAPGLDERLQRAQSAMLANELDTARRILNEAPELQRAQPQLRYRLAQVDFRAGQYARGLATLDALLASDEARADPLFDARLHKTRGAMLIRLDRYAEAERSYDASVRQLEGTPHAAELGHALLGRAVARSSQGRFDAALADLGVARVQLVHAGDPLSVARVDANLGNLEMDRERPAQAISYFQKAARDFESMGAVNELAGIRGMLMTAQLQLLQTGDALALSERSWAMRERLRDPAQRANVILGRAEALLAVGRLREAGELLRMPEAGPVVPGDFRRREFLQVELAWRGGDARSAVVLADAALADWPPQHSPRRRAWTELRRRQAALAADLAPRSIDAGVLGDSLADRLSRAMQQRAAGNVAAADASFRAALAHAEQRGIPSEIAEAVRAHADWLLDRGRLAEAGALVGRVAPWAERDFALALLQVRLYRQLGQEQQWRAALAQARRLAGERPIAAELAMAPPKWSAMQLQATDAQRKINE